MSRDAAWRVNLLSGVLLAGVLAGAMVWTCPALAQIPPASERPDLEGFWTNQSVTKLERPPRRRRAEAGSHHQTRPESQGSPPLRAKTDPGANRLPRDHPCTRKRTDHELQKPDKFIR